MAPGSVARRLRGLARHVAVVAAPVVSVQRDEFRDSLDGLPRLAIKNAEGHDCGRPEPPLCIVQ